MNIQSKQAHRINPISNCPVANTLDILGEKWTLLIIRDLFQGKKTYGDFKHSLESIPTNLLALRLKRLEKEGIIYKEQYQSKPVRYAYLLTTKGRDLRPLLEELLAWGKRYFPNTGL